MSAELDGEPVEPAALSALALVNYGHFTTMLVEHGAVRGLSLHLDRLVADCRTVHDAELDPDRVRALARRAVTRPRQLVRVTVFDPALDLGRPGAPATPRILVTTRSATPVPATPVRLVSTPFARQLPAVKHTGLFGTVHARRAAQRAGADDALFLAADGSVTEGPTWNIGFVDGDGLVWPDADVLVGVTQRLIGGPCRAVPLKMGCRTACFIANAAVGVRPVGSIDGRAVPQDAAALDRLRRRYAAVSSETL